MNNRTEVFVSYSHADSEHLVRLKVHLRPYERESQLELWSDTKIRTGQQWRKEIDAALGRAAVAILLVSADFLASDFVAENELPPLLEAAKQEGVKILPIILKPCAFTATKSLSIYQSLNDPAKPLIALTEAEREAVWDRLASEVKLSVEEFKSRGTRTRKARPAEPFFRGSGEAPAIVQEEIMKPERIENFHVYQYQHVDLLDFMPSARAVLQDVSNADVVLKAVQKRLMSEGWEGDGVIQLMWLPPFVGAGVEDTFGVAVWFVKQRNNGTAFMASPVPLPFSRLLQQQ